MSTRVSAPMPGSTRVEYALFATTLGWCGIAWCGGRVIAVQLPALTSAATRDVLLRRLHSPVEASPPHHIAAVIEGIANVIDGHGDGVSFSDVDVDLDDVPSFDRAVYAAARSIPHGETATYGSIAAQIGHPQAARQVGAALGRNPVPIIVPCHRVVAANGSTGGFSAPGGVTTKLRLLAAERALGPLFARP